MFELRQAARQRPPIGHCAPRIEPRVAGIFQGQQRAVVLSEPRPSSFRLSTRRSISRRRAWTLRDIIERCVGVHGPCNEWGIRAPPPQLCTVYCATRSGSGAEHVGPPCASVTVQLIDSPRLPPAGSAPVQRAAKRPRTTTLSHPSAVRYTRNRRWGSGPRGPAVLPPAPPVRRRVLPMRQGHPLASGLASHMAHMARPLL